MTVAARLRSLDDRVLGPARIAARPKHRTTFAIGCAASLAVLLTAVLSGRTVLLSGAGGFFGVTIVGGVAWAHSHWPARRRTALLVTAALSLLVVAWTAALLTQERWAEDDSGPPGVVFRP